MCNNIDSLHEECGVIGIFDENSAVNKRVWEGLYALQHRGQESAGIAVYSGDTIHIEKGNGLISEGVDDQAFAKLPKSHLSIGHVRYSALRENTSENIQPHVARYSDGWIALAHNGSTINIKQIEKELFAEGEFFQSTGDSEVLLALIVKHARSMPIEEAVAKAFQSVKGSFASVIMVEGKLIAVRDPLGIKPFAIGKFGESSFCVASESCAIDTIGAEFIRDIRPGEIIIIDKNGLNSIQYESKANSALCVFEYVYFARPDSVIDSLGVYKARFEMGRRLARLWPVKADFVAGVPDSALPCAKGYAFESQIPYRDALVRNRYMGRTFIQPEQSMRERGVYLKLSALSSTVEGKSIVLVDDSIVRGTTSKKIVEMLKQAGAREVHVRIASPPVRFPCFYGVDTPTKEELTSSRFSADYVRDLIKADSLGYISDDMLLDSVKEAKIGMCTACFDGKYPVEVDK